MAGSGGERGDSGGQEALPGDRLGHGHRRSVFILWAWTALLSGFVLYPIYSGSGDGLVPFGIAAILLSLYMFLHPGLRTKRGEGDLGDDGGEPPPEPPVVGPVSHRPPASGSVDESA